MTYSKQPIKEKQMQQEFYALAAFFMLYRMQYIIVVPRIDHHSSESCNQAHLLSTLPYHKVFLYSITNIKTFGTRCKPSTKLFDDSLLQFIMLAYREREVLAIDSHRYLLKLLFRSINTNQRFMIRKEMRHHFCRSIASYHSQKFLR